ncbi:MAG: hypothetical protein GF421_07020 [Candidatus Aminicenantes bacterium]|nr:hypothetical protein [Candidatus Aminicenantes bacterium]
MESPKKSSTKNWLIGCGIGCGVVIVIGIVLVVSGVFFVKNMVNTFEESEDVLKTLTKKYGKIYDYSPSPYGSIKSSRMEVFLNTRESLKTVKEELERSIEFLSEEQKDEREPKRKSGGVLKKIRTGIGLIPRIAEYLKQRNQALLEAGMGIGEYYYIYTISYYGWLNKPITDGLPIDINDDNGFDYQHWEDEESKEIRHDLAVRRLHQMILPMLKNQQEQLLEKSQQEQISDAWAKALEQEIKALESNRYRLIWQDGLPEVIVSSLRPYKHRLESSYSPSLNNIEMIIEQH